MQKKNSNKIDSLEKSIINGTEQWVLIRGNDRSKPVLLFIQAGPGFPIIHEAREMERVLKLEDHFVVVYWDQRACGKSFSAKIPPQSLNLNQLVSDTHELVEKIKGRMGVGKIYVAGFSLGGTVGALTAYKYPKSLHAFIGVGMDIKMDTAEQTAYTFALKRAKETGNKKAANELQKIGPPPHIDAKKFLTRVKWVANFGGVNRQETYNTLLRKTMKNMIASPEYSWFDIIKTLRGMNFSQKYLLKDLISLNMFDRVPKLEVPVYLFQGRHDHAAPPALLEQYYEKLEAPAGKQLIWFEHSAHMPHYEEPEKFRSILVDRILTETYKSTS